MDIMKFLKGSSPKQETNKPERQNHEVTGIKEIAEALGGVIDPETGVDIVSLGLIYDIAMKNDIVYIKMTMTTPTCPMTGLLMDMSKEAVENLPGITLVEIDLVWEPRWSVAMMSDQAKKQLGW